VSVRIDSAGAMQEHRIERVWIRRRTPSLELTQLDPSRWPVPERVVTNQGLGRSFDGLRNLARTTTRSSPLRRNV
jgi:hypothetical protein